MPIVQIRELPPFRFVCRPVPPTIDIDLLLAEAGALMLWAEENGCATDRESVWCVLDAAGVRNALEVAVPVAGEAPQDDGLVLRRAESLVFAVATCAADLPAARECADRLRGWPGTEPSRPLPGAAAWIRIDPDPTHGLAGATVHVPLT